GLSVPGDVALVGFDDIPAASFTNPPLTTVSQDVKAAGEALVDTLLRKIRGQAVEPYMLPTQLIVRGSSG
ncbi:substrate-binding domain-containing protein, partial [Blastomonas sp. UPD001]